MDLHLPSSMTLDRNCFAVFVTTWIKNCLLLDADLHEDEIVFVNESTSSTFRIQCIIQKKLLLLQRGSGMIFLPVTPSEETLFQAGV